ncbi:MAG: winged helix-turn-helix transcriptional regulator [Candidatus Thorarchaeota archaeon]
MKEKKFNRYILTKFGILTFSFILLSIILFFLILSYEAVLAPEEIINLSIIIISILIAAVLSVSIFEVLTIKEYKGFFIKKVHIKRGKSYLTIADIFENEHRVNILTQILNNPGIHQNELRRSCNLQKGQIQWHLDVLLRNHIIKKEKYGQYTIYFPITSSVESIEKFKNLPKKSETTSRILEIIQTNPGITSSEIAKKINLARNTVKYHIDKLSENELIFSKEKGRKIEIYPKAGKFNN